MKYRIILFLLTLRICTLTYSQNTVVDSLLNELQNTRQDTTKVILNNNIAKALYKTRPEEALLYAKEAYCIAEKGDIGQYKSVTNDILAATNWLLGKYDSAIVYVQENIHIFDSIQDERKLAIAYHHLSVILGENPQRADQALEYAEKAAEICKENHFDGVLASVESQIGKIYTEDKHDYQAAQEYFENALRIYTELGDSLKIGYIHNNLGRTYFLNRKYEKALKSYKISLKVCTANRDNNCICYVTANIGDIYKEKHDYNKARQYYQQSLDTSKQYHLKKIQLEAYEKLAQIDSLRGDFQTSLFYLHQYYHLRNQLLSKEKEDKISELMIKYEAEKSERENEILKEKENIQKISVIAISVFAFLVIIISLILWHYLRIQKKSNIALSRKNQEINSQKKEISLHKGSLRIRAEELKAHKDHLADLVTQKTLELIDAMEIAEESKRLKTAFLNNISHEYRTPMNGIMGFAQLLNDPDISVEEHGVFIKLINKSANDLLNLVTDTVEISKIHTQQEEYFKSSINIQDIISEVLYQQSDVLKSKKIETKLEINCSQDELLIQSDEGKIRRIFHHLVDNAIKFTTVGFIGVYCSVNDNKQLLFQIQDTGQGIAADSLEVIFEKFRQIDVRSTSNVGGSGLGLSIVKAYVNLLQGEIWIESKPGEGTNVFFTIPLEKDEMVKTQVMEKKPMSIHGKTILMAEDNEVNYLLVKKILSRFSCRLLHAWNGKEAISMMKEEPDIHLVLMDLMMPIMNGYESADIIKKSYPHIPIVALTAYASEREIYKLRDQNFEAYITKPIDIVKFIDAIERHII